VNNFFTGLFHDLPEVLTRDIISPVKRSVEGLETIIKEFEKEKMDETVYKLLPEEWHEEMRLFTENEFQGVVYENGTSVPVDSETIHMRYNEDQYNPRDGELIEAIDRLAAFLEAYMALRNGCRSEEFDDAIHGIKQKYSRTIAGIDFGAILSDFS
jgi:putative hydrolase of HD superfamily